ncbi:MAG: amidohydrolase family protein [Thermogutta sp.]
MKWTRRRFLQAAGFMAGGVASGVGRWRVPAGSLAGVSVPPDVEKIPIVDTHQHLWDLSRLRLPWLAGDSRLNRDYLLRDYLQAVAGLPVVKAVYMEVAVVDEDVVKEAEWIIDICHRGEGPTVAAVIGGRPASEEFPAYLARFRGNPVVKGVRWIPPASKLGHKLYFSPQMRANLRLLGEWGMRFDICIPPDWLADAVEIVDACPETRFVLDHCGNADPQQFGRWGKERGEEAVRYVERWKRGIDTLAARQNVVCKISGIIARVKPNDWGPEDLAPIVNHCLAAFGPDRVMFAGDWPVCTKGASLREWILALHQIVADRPLEERRKLFHDNAVRFYQLG